MEIPSKRGKLGKQPLQSAFQEVLLPKLTCKTCLGIMLAHAPFQRKCMRF